MKNQEKKHKVVLSLGGNYKDTNEAFLTVKKALKRKKEDLAKNKAGKVTGFCVFVEYHPVLSDELAIANPYTKTLINKEYNDIHDKADKCIAGFIDEVRTAGDKYYKGGLVKQKRFRFLQ